MKILTTAEQLALLSDSDLTELYHQSADEVADKEDFKKLYVIARDLAVIEIRNEIIRRWLELATNYESQLATS